MSKERKPTSKRMRFEVFKRDNFECQYCGAKPPKIPLELDHIIPVSKNGKTIIDNLITACFDCNRGKTNIELDSVPTPLIDNMERKKIGVYEVIESMEISCSKIHNSDDSLKYFCGICWNKIKGE